MVGTREVGSTARNESGEVVGDQQMDSRVHPT